MTEKEKDLIFNNYTQKFMDSVVFSKIIDVTSGRKGFEETTDDICDYAFKVLNEVLKEVGE